MLKQRKRSTGSPTKAVDGLIRIANREDVSLFASEILKQIHLGEIGILKFVHQNEAGAPTLPS